jgi:outer membrane immunogenic protein
MRRECVCAATRAGWAAGGGVEWKFMRSWPAKVEYLHIDLGNITVSVTDIGPSFSAHNQFDTVRLGVNHHFN